MTVDLHRNALAQALLDASTQRTFPLTVHQFIRLGGVWFDAGFKRMLGIRSTKLAGHLGGFKGTMSGLRAKPAQKSKAGWPPVSVSA
jgi:hypothetical protein